MWNRIFNSLGDVSEKWNDGNSTNNDIREFSGNTKKMIFGVSQLAEGISLGGGLLYCKAERQCCVGPLGWSTSLHSTQNLENRSEEVHISRPEVFDEIRKENLSKYGAWALVTGCTRGIGREYALGLARWGSQHFEVDVKSGNNVNRSAITCISLPFPPEHHFIFLCSQPHS